MYSTCLFCTSTLGANEVLESFPVGRRIAFDEGKGRLWVVCRKCERWNLSPLEERWETVEACERLFRETRVRVSTENVGLARLPEGLELVRIGQPLRPEFAAWRYGDQFGRRRRRVILYGSGAAVLASAVIIGGAAAGIGGALLAQTGNLVNLVVHGRSTIRFRGEDGTLHKLRLPDLRSIRMVVPGPGEHWRIQYQKGKTRVLLVGPEAERFAGAALSRLNGAGGSRKQVQEAVSEIERVGGPEPFLLAMTRRSAPWSGLLTGAVTSSEDPLTISNMVKPVAELSKPLKLGIEMALHEEQERRALQGELELLETAWREAEEIAGIADDLLVPDRARSFLDRARGTGPAERKPPGLHDG